MWLLQTLRKLFEFIFRLLTKDEVPMVTQIHQTRKGYYNRCNSVMSGSYCKGIKPFMYNHKPLA